MSGQVDDIHSTERVDGLTWMSEDLIFQLSFLAELCNQI